MNQHPLVYITAACLGGVLGYYTLKLYTKYKGILNVLDNYKDFSIQIYDHYVVIPYLHHGISYKVYLPYDESKVEMMSQYSAYADCDSIINISQQPGIPYVINSDDLDASKITLLHVEDELKDKVYIHNIPYYGDE